jgi:hypothetical protein
MVTSSDHRYPDRIEGTHDDITYGFFYDVTFCDGDRGNDLCIIAAVEDSVLHSDTTQDRTTCGCAVRSPHYRTYGEKKLIFFCPFLSLFDPFSRDSFPRTKTIFFFCQKKINVSKIE